MTDDDLMEIQREAVRKAMDIAVKRDGTAWNTSTESLKAGLRAVADAVWDEGYTVGNAHDGRRDANPYRAQLTQQEDRT